MICLPYDEKIDFGKATTVSPAGIALTAHLDKGGVRGLFIIIPLQRRIMRSKGLGNRVSVIYLDDKKLQYYYIYCCSESPNVGPISNFK